MQWEKGHSNFENSLITTGICSTNIDPDSVRDQDDFKMYNKYVIDGGDLHIHLTDIGYTLKTYMLLI
jgi:hypothetical protein